MKANDAKLAALEEPPPYMVRLLVEAKFCVLCLVSECFAFLCFVSECFLHCVFVFKGMISLNLMKYCVNVSRG